MKFLIRLLRYFGFQRVKSLDSSMLSQVPNLTISKNIHVDNDWDQYLAQICDDMKDYPESFLRASSISKILHPNQQELGEKYFKLLCKDSYFGSEILPKVSEPAFGTPFLMDVFPYLSPLSCQHHWHMFQIRKNLGIDLTKFNGELVEFGGGYGNMARLLRSFGNRSRYSIIDLPEMLALQKFYLGNVFSKNEIDEFYFSDLKNFRVPEEDFFFFASFSLNECSMNTRVSVEKIIARSSSFTILYNKFFSGVNNTAYFNDLADKLEERFDCKIVQDPCREVFYLLGRRR